MSDVKTMYFPDGNSNSALETALLANGGGMGGFNNPIWALVFLAFLGRNGMWGGGNENCQLSQIQSQLNTNQGQTLLMDAIKGNAGAIRDLASSINCNHNAVTAAINGVQAAICNVGNSVGYNAMQTINAINSGNASLANTLQNCCCDIKQQTITQGYENRINNLQQSQLIQNGFAQVGYAAAENACAIKQNATDNTSRVLAKLDAIEDSRKDREIATLTTENANLRARAERQTENAANFAPIYQRLSEIERKQQDVVTVPANHGVLVPSCVAWNAGLYGAYGLNPFGLNNGQWS